MSYYDVKVSSIISDNNDIPNSYEIKYDSELKNIKLINNNNESQEAKTISIDTHAGIVSLNEFIPEYFSLETGEISSFQNALMSINGQQIKNRF